VNPGRKKASKSSLPFAGIKLSEMAIEPVENTAHQVRIFLGGWSAGTRAFRVSADR
jgi:hypothetical protein